MELNLPLSELVRALARIASYHLQERPDFPVAGAQIDRRGQISLCKPLGLVEDASIQQRVELLLKTFRSSVQSGDLIACAISAPVIITHPKTGERGPSILVTGESEDGSAVDVFVSYSRNPAFSLGSPIVVSRAQQIFVAQAVE